MYDCGSYQSKELEQYIDSIDKGIETILVVSHLHKDHINCIPYLLDSKLKITRLVMPNISENIRKIFATSLDSDTSDSLYDFIFNPRSMFETISLVNKRIETSDNLVDRGEIPFSEASGSIYDDALYMILNDGEFAWAAKFWVDKYVYNELNEKQFETINSAILDDFKNTKKRNELISIYASISEAEKEKLNTTSMLMGTFPHIMAPKKSHYTCFHDCYFMCGYSERFCGFMCTGDYPIKEKCVAFDIAKHYSKQQFYFKEMMAPHHASNGYFEHLPFLYMDKAYSQTTKTKRYNHPGSKTEANMKKWNLEFENIVEK